MEVKVSGQVFGVEAFPTKKGDIPIVKMLLNLGNGFDPFKFFVPKDHPVIKAGPVECVLKVQQPYSGGFGAELRLMSVTPVAK